MHSTIRETPYNTFCLLFTSALIYNKYSWTCWLLFQQGQITWRTDYTSNSDPFRSLWNKLQTSPLISVDWSLNNYNWATGVSPWSAGCCCISVGEHGRVYLIKCMHCLKINKQGITLYREHIFASFKVWNSVISRPCKVKKKKNCNIIFKSRAALICPFDTVLVSVWIVTEHLCVDPAWSSHSSVLPRRGDVPRDAAPKQNKRFWGNMSVHPGFSLATQGWRRTPM